MQSYPKKQTTIKLSQSKQSQIVKLLLITLLCISDSVNADEQAIDSVVNSDVNTPASLMAHSDIYINTTTTTQNGQATARHNTYHCSDTPVSVIATSTQDLALICDGAQQAAYFLAQYQLVITQTIVIRIIERPLSFQGYSAYGSYNKHTNAIEIMSLAYIQQHTDTPTMYGQPFDQIHYKAAVAHEMVHSISHQNSPLDTLSQSAQEYLAHATQLAVLPTHYRSVIINAANIEPWLPGDTISDIYMAISPTKFAVKSYLHLTTTADPSAFVNIILNAKWMYVDAS